MKTKKELLNRLIMEGGIVVSSASLSADHIKTLQTKGDFYVDKDGFGFAWLPSIYWVDIL